jgi:hypothetical protein
MEYCLICGMLNAWSCTHKEKEMPESNRIAEGEDDSVDSTDEGD